MSFAALSAEFTREPFFFVEIEIEEEIFRFCTRRSFIPIGLDAVPCLAAQPSISAAEADLSGGLGIRASVSCKFDDFADSDTFGTVAAPVNFWPTFRARYPFYEGARLSVFSGYLNGDYYTSDTAEGYIDPDYIDPDYIETGESFGPQSAAFLRRDYVIDKFSWGKGTCTIVAKDPLKLTSNNRAQVPAASRGVLKDPISAGATSITLDPPGIGAAEYPTSGHIRIRTEVMSFTRSADVLTVVRARYNTAAVSHAVGSTAQLCAIFSDTVDNLVSGLMQSAGVVPEYINAAGWAAEASTYLPGLYSAIVTEPTAVGTLLKELAEQAPHFVYWDDRANLIQFVAIKPPPESAPVLDWQDSILEDSFSAQDEPDMRVSRVFVYFGQFDPTRKLDETNNYQQTFIRVDLDSELNYGSPRVRTVFSRWISNTNKASAVRLAARIGRRFSAVPKRVQLAVDPKTQDVWTGDTMRVLHPDIVDAAGVPELADFQVLKAAERKSRYELSGLEYLYGPSVPEDEDIDDLGKTVILSGDLFNINLRTIFNGLFPSVLPDDDVKFIIDSSGKVGSTSIASYSLVTGTWPELLTPPTLVVRGVVGGRGGKGADVGGSPELGGPAILLQDDLILDNTGLIVNGAAGGVSAEESSGFAVAEAGGGGGSGVPGGAAGSGTSSSDPGIIQLPMPGGVAVGGQGGYATAIIDGAEPSFAAAAAEPGNDAGSGSAAAINRAGFTLTYINAGDIRGAIL